jgi:hypothetical protein
MVRKMKAAVFVEPGRITLDEKPIPAIGPLDALVHGYEEGQRVIAGAITPSGWSNACLCGACSQDGAGTRHGWKPLGGWRFGNTIDGCQAEYVRVPDAMANLAPVPDGLSDEQVLMCPDIMSTGFSGAESAGRNPAPDWRTRRRRLDRGARDAADLRSCIAGAEAGRHLVQPRRLLHGPEDSAGCIPCRLGRPNGADHVFPHPGPH